MPYGLYVSSEGAHAQSKRLDIIANNLANVDTVAFKREVAVFQARYAEAIQQGQQIPGTGAIEDVGGGVLFRETRTDFSLGPLKTTGRRTDMAIHGEGFFVVRKGEEELLTRAGNFRINSRGELTTQQGYPVLSDVGVPIVVNPDDPRWQFLETGTIRQAGATQNLALVKPESLGDLVKVGENLFRPLAEPRPLAPAERSVVDKTLELSGVNPTSEMIEMIRASRELEANINMMKTQDQMLGALINRVLRS